jgi:hypothetical protein
MNISNEKINMKALYDLVNKPAGIVIFPKQGIGKSRIVEAVDKFMKKGWDAISTEQRQIVREVVRDNPRFSFGKEVPKND